MKWPIGTKAETKSGYIVTVTAPNTVTYENGVSVKIITIKGGLTKLQKEVTNNENSSYQENQTHSERN